MNIKEYLYKNGPNLSSNIQKELVKKGFSKTTARQRISRADDILRLKEILFPNNEYFLYLKEQYGSYAFNTRLACAFKTSSSVHKCLITGLINYGGSAPVSKLKILSGCPKARKKKKSFDQIINELLKVGLINIDNKTCYLHDDLFSPNKSYTSNRAINCLNDIFKELLAVWLKNNSFISYNSTLFNKDFCSYNWDIVAPSFLLPFISKRGGKRKFAFIVADIIPQYELNEDDVDYFIRKVQSCFMEKNAISFLPIMVGFGFNKSAWTLLKKRNIMAVTVRNFFGEENEKLLVNIMKLLELKIIQDTEANIDIKQLIEAVAKLEGPTNNLRGHFFELIVGYIARKEHSGEVILNKKLKNDKGKKEIDVLIRTSNKIIVYECKGKNKEQLVSEDEISLWKGKIAFIYDYFKNEPEYSGHQLCFNFWTTSDFSEDANNEFRKLTPKKYSVNKMNGKEVLEFAKTLKLEEMCALLKEYFIM